jgi:tetratricopeptide (TPR) repeat protein
MHHHHAPDGEKLGSVSFPVSCEPASKLSMERGVALLHSKCAMAHWGVAMSGQAEVDLPAREMLGDMLIELKRPKEALVECKVALTLSPNRLNGLYGAGRAAEALGMKKEAGEYYAAMLKNTGDGAHSPRPSLAHAKAFLAGKVVARD